MSEYYNVVSSNKSQIKELIKTKQSLKIDIAELAVEKIDTEKEIKKIEESSHKTTNEIIKQSKHRDRILEEIDDLRELFALVNDRKLFRMNEMK
jgi:chromosome segregation ATPase